MNKNIKDKKEDFASNLKNLKNDDFDQKIKKLEETVADLKQQLEEMEGNWKRALADYKNLERRTSEEKEEVARFANFVLVAELISVYDNLEMLKKHSDDKGLKMIADQFAEILHNAGLEKLESLGKDFDEAYMEAIDTKEADEEDENKVLEEALLGYKFKNRLIRPAKVIVGKSN